MVLVVTNTWIDVVIEMFVTLVIKSKSLLSESSLLKTVLEISVNIKVFDAISFVSEEIGIC